LFVFLLEGEKLITVAHIKLLAIGKIKKIDKCTYCHNFDIDDTTIVI